jgi:hypothetical protein
MRRFLLLIALAGLIGMFWILIFPFVVEASVPNYAPLLCNPGETLRVSMYRSTMRSSYHLYCEGPDYLYDPFLRQMLISVVLVAVMVASLYFYSRGTKPLQRKTTDAPAPDLPSDTPLTDKLHDLEQAYHNGLLREDEYERKRREIVDGFQ